MSKLSRLSAENIEDDILRADFFAVIKRHISRTGNLELFEYTIRPDETHRADLVSYRAYGNVDLEWLIYLVCDLDDPADPLPVGQIIRLPASAWVRRTMRQFMDEAGL